MEETIDIFLELAREGSLVGDIDFCSLRLLVEDVVESHRHALADRPVEIENRVPDDVVVETSERALSIVLGNLIGNAFSRTEEGAVTIDWREGGVEIADTGPGIRGRDLGRVTDRHFTGNGGGYGLGLSIVQTLCGKFGWGLELKPESPGTVVRLTFDQ
jgi:signal transduction histidine kinase